MIGSAEIEMVLGVGFDARRVIQPLQFCIEAVAGLGILGREQPVAPGNSIQLGSNVDGCPLSCGNS